MLGRIFALAGRIPPDSIQLWNAGANETDYGTHYWTERSVLEVLGKYEERGNPLVVDLDHNLGKALAAGALPPGEPVQTAGYARLELRGGLPFLHFDWSEEGAAQIASGQRRFLSPEYLTDEETGEIVRLIRVSLVADPGTHHARILASAKGMVMIDPAMRAALNACLSAEDPKEAIEALLAEVDKATGAPGAESPAENDAAAKPAEGMPASEPKPYAAAEPPKEEPVKAAAMGPDGKPCAANSEERPAVAASAKPNAPPPAPIPPKLGKVVIPAAAGGAQLDANAQHVVAAAKASGDGALVAVENLKRDILVRDNKAKIPPTLHTWASSQPLAVVESYLKSLPDDLAPPAVPSPTRGGAPNGGPPVRHHLTGAKRAEFERAMGSAPMPPIGPTRSPEGYLRVHAGCPGEYRAQEAAKQARK